MLLDLSLCAARFELVCGSSAFSCDCRHGRHEAEGPAGPNARRGAEGAGSTGRCHQTGGNVMGAATLIDWQ